MPKTQRLDSELAQYSIAAQAVLDLKKPTKRLGDLALYTAAAGSALALAPAAEAAIIYSGIQNITVNRVTNGTGSALVDVDGDGQNNFVFEIYSTKTGGTQFDAAVASGYPSPPLYGTVRFFDNISSSLLKLAASSRTVGPNYNNTNTLLKYFGGLRGHSATTGGSSVFGLWNIGPNAATTAFAGVMLGGATNPALNQFGWLRFKLTTDSENRTASLTLIDWAFQSVSGVGIHVGDRGTTSIPEPSTLGLLALGAAGLAALRRRRGEQKQAGGAH